MSHRLIWLRLSFILLSVQRSAKVNELVTPAGFEIRSWENSTKKIASDN